MLEYDSAERVYRVVICELRSELVFTRRMQRAVSSMFCATVCKIKDFAVLFKDTNLNARRFGATNS